MALCRLCSTREADSEEHVVLSALGGRLAVGDVLCKPCNDRLGATIDAETARRFEGIRAMLGIEGDRGQIASVRATDETGAGFIIQHGGSIRAAPARPVIEHEDADSFRATHNSVEDGRIYSEAIQRKNPDRTVVVTGVTEKIRFPGPLTFKFDFGGADFLRSSTRSVLALLAHRELEPPGGALANAWRYVGGAEPDECGVRVTLPTRSGAWPAPPQLGTVSHRIAIRAIAAEGVLAADVRYFGELGALIHIACALPHSFGLAYGIDPVCGESVTVDDWEGEIEGSNDDAAGWIRHLEEAAKPILARYREREVEFLSAEILAEKRREALSIFPDGPADERFGPYLARLVSDEIARILKRQDESYPAPELVSLVQPRKR